MEYSSIHKNVITAMENSQGSVKYSFFLAKWQEITQHSRT